LHFLFFYFLQTFCCSNIPCTSIIKESSTIQEHFRKSRIALFP
jgi:hypothetical protein